MEEAYHLHPAASAQLINSVTAQMAVQVRRSGKPEHTIPGQLGDFNSTSELMTAHLEKYRAFLKRLFAWGNVTAESKKVHHAAVSEFFTDAPLPSADYYSASRSKGGLNGHPLPQSSADEGEVGFTVRTGSRGLPVLADGICVSWLDTEVWADVYGWPGNEQHEAWRLLFWGLGKILNLRGLRHESDAMFKQAAQGVSLGGAKRRYLYRQVFRGITEKYQIKATKEELHDLARGTILVDMVDAARFEEVVDHRMNTTSYLKFSNFWNPKPGTPSELRGV